MSWNSHSAFPRSVAGTSMVLRRQEAAWDALKRLFGVLGTARIQEQKIAYDGVSLEFSGVRWYFGLPNYQRGLFPPWLLVDGKFTLGVNAEGGEWYLRFEDHSKVSWVIFRGKAVTGLGYYWYADSIRQVWCDDQGNRIVPYDIQLEGQSVSSKTGDVLWPLWLHSDVENLAQSMHLVGSGELSSSGNIRVFGYAIPDCEGC